jgi:hypothetical protein
MCRHHLFIGSAAASTFRLNLSDGVSRLLLSHLSGKKIDAATRKLYQYSYNRLTSSDPTIAWTSGLWMTEKEVEVTLLLSRQLPSSPVYLIPRRALGAFFRCEQTWARLTSDILGGLAVEDVNWNVRHSYLRLYHDIPRLKMLSRQNQLPILSQDIPLLGP